MTEKTASVDTNQISDGYHTFGELYDHRIELWIALCRNINNVYVWRSMRHSDGSSLDGWFVLGMKVTPGTQITYHLPLDRWGSTDFAQTLEHAPEFDGHTSADVIQRLKSL